MSQISSICARKQTKVTGIGARLTKLPGNAIFVLPPRRLIFCITAEALQKRDIAVDDNAVLLLGYQHALGLSEASWTQIGHLTSYTPVFYGSMGTLVVHPDKLQLATNAHPDGEFVEVPDPPTEVRTATDYFLSRLTSGQPVEGLCNVEISRDAQEILEAGLISARTGTEVSLPLRLSLG